jgi:hypothetical protein
VIPLFKRTFKKAFQQFKGHRTFLHLDDGCNGAKRRRVIGSGVNLAEKFGFVLLSLFFVALGLSYIYITAVIQQLGNCHPLVFLRTNNSSSSSRIASLKSLEIWYMKMYD